MTTAVPSRAFSMVSRSAAAPHGAELRRLRITQLSEADRAAWTRLERNALEPNAFLSPEFLEPALRHLDPEQQTELLVLESHRGGEPHWEALMPLQPAPADRLIPLPHHRAHASLHAFVNGILLPREGAREALVALVAAWRRHFRHGLELRDCRLGGPTDRLLQAVAAEAGLRRIELDVFERALMQPAAMGEADILARLPSRAKKLKATKKKLAEAGPLRFAVYRGAAISSEVIERHLVLEHMGWKGENGTSMRSHPAQEAFFREMAGNFARSGRGVFAELWAGDTPLHSSSNLTAGDMGFAFKVGFDPRFSAHSPGVVGELEFMREAPTALADLALFDSGSVAGSFIEGLWPLRQRMGTVVLGTSWLGNRGIDAAQALRQWKRARAERAAQAAAADPAPAATGATPAAPAAAPATTATRPSDTA